MKKITLILFTLISIINAGNKFEEIAEEKQLYYAPFKTDKIIKYLNKDKHSYKTLLMIYRVTNNKVIREKVIYKLKGKKPYDNSQESKLFLALDKEDFKKIESIFSDEKTRKIRNKRLKSKIYAIKAGIVKGKDSYLYKKYNDLGLKYATNNSEFYYLLYKSLYKNKKYDDAFQYLKLIYNIDYYKYIEEDLFDVSYKSALNNFNNEEYFKAWIIGIDGLSYISNINYNRHIKEIIKLKEIVFKSSQKILNDKNKKIDNNLYIIQKTRKALSGEEEK